MSDRSSTRRELERTVVEYEAGMVSRGYVDGAITRFESAVESDSISGYAALSNTEPPAITAAKDAVVEAARAESQRRFTSWALVDALYALDRLTASEQETSDEHR